MWLLKFPNPLKYSYTSYKYFINSEALPFSVMRETVHELDLPNKFLRLVIETSDFPDGSVVKNPRANEGDRRCLGGEDTKETEMGTHSSILACKIS